MYCDCWFFYYEVVVWYKYIFWLIDLNKKEDVYVLVIGLINRLDLLDFVLRRAGRFDKEICFGILDEKVRVR